MDKYCDRESDELVPSDPYLAQLADEIALENTYRSRSDRLCKRDEPNASDSGDGSESAGLRRLAGTWPHEKDLSNSAHWHMSELPCLAECRRCQLEAALAPAISRPPTQGSAGQECADCDKLIGERDEMEERVNNIVAALGIQEPDSDWSNLNDPSERAIEKIEALLAAQTPSASPGERCHAGSDGDCDWAECPQEANSRANYQTFCPLATPDEEGE